jgi:hypothetical protein
VSLPRGLGAALLCAAALPASAGHDARDDAARAAVYDHLLSAGFSLNYDTPRPTAWPCSRRAPTAS